MTKKNGTLHTQKYRIEVAKALGGSKGRRHADAVGGKTALLHAGHVSLSLWKSPHGPRAQLHDWRYSGPLLSTERTVGASSNWLGFVRTAGGKRRDQERRKPRQM